MDTTRTGDDNPPEAEAVKDSMIVVEVGKKQSGKRIRQLQKGRGKLFENIEQMMEELRAKGAIGENAQPVVVVVKKKSRTLLGW